MLISGGLGRLQSFYDPRLVLCLLIVFNKKFYPTRCYLRPFYRPAAPNFAYVVLIYWIWRKLSAYSFIPAYSFIRNLRIDKKLCLFHLSKRKKTIIWSWRNEATIARQILIFRCFNNWDSIICEILWVKRKQLQLHKLFDIIVKLICAISKNEARLSYEYFMSIFGHIFRFFCFLNTLPMNFYHSIFHLSHFCTCP